MPSVAPTFSPTTLAPTATPTTTTPTTATPTTAPTTTAPTTVGDGRTAGSDGGYAAQRWFKDNHDMAYYLAMGVTILIVVVGCGIYNKVLCHRQPPESGACIIRDGLSL